MKNSISFFAVLIVMLSLVAGRLLYIDHAKTPSLNITTWDALGYYMYLPSSHIYHDEKKLDWLDSNDKKYNLSGGTIYQASIHKNGNKVFKYLRGVSILQTPFYLIGHAYALHHKQYRADGFSAPYQYALAFGLIFFLALSFFLLRHVLLYYYKDIDVAITLLLLMLASNAFQYMAIDSGQSHSWIFPLYVLILFLTIQWHRNYSILVAFCIGITIGLATISRPTEAVMIFIPLLWHANDPTRWKEKWLLLRQSKLQWLALLGGGISGILPQLLYWKRVTGSWIYDVGSKWDFLQPHFKVLFGWEKGWFIYTPVAILFMIGLFFMKGKSFKTSIITFCLLNIYIIISWHIWRYGASYSTRALVQSYPIFALPLCGFIEFVNVRKWRILLIPFCLFLIGSNLFQIYQYNLNILHYDDMNREYYGAIYLNPSPSAVSMSLLDTKDFISNEQAYTSQHIFSSNQPIQLATNSILYADSINTKSNISKHYLKFKTIINSGDKLWGHYLFVQLKSEGMSIEKKFRLFHPLSKNQQFNRYEFYVELPPGSSCHASLQILGDNYSGKLSTLDITYLYK